VKLNLELFKKVKAHILAEPKRLRQKTWVCTEGDDLFPIHVKRKRYKPPCGTAACFGGWTVLLGKKTPTPLSEIIGTAKQLLVEGPYDPVVLEARANLYLDVFYYFPESELNGGLTPGTLRYAKAVVARADEFIERWKGSQS